VQNCTIQRQIKRNGGSTYYSSTTSVSVDHLQNCFEERDDD
jgi:hypothetical protein